MPDPSPCRTTGPKVSPLCYKVHGCRINLLNASGVLCAVQWYSPGLFQHF